jgi:hypothetical protein
MPFVIVCYNRINQLNIHIKVYQEWSHRRLIFTYFIVILCLYLNWQTKLGKNVYNLLLHTLI